MGMPWPSNATTLQVRNMVALEEDTYQLTAELDMCKTQIRGSSKHTKNPDIISRTHRIQRPEKIFSLLLSKKLVGPPTFSFFFFALVTYTESTGRPWLATPYLLCTDRQRLHASGPNHAIPGPDLSLYMLSSQHIP